MRPEVYGAISLACRTLSRLSRAPKKRKAKLQQKLDKHIARARRYLGWS